MNPEVEQMKDREKMGQKARAAQQSCMLHCSGVTPTSTIQATTVQTANQTAH